MLQQIIKTIYTDPAVLREQAKRVPSSLLQQQNSRNL
jgi:hypothetical protein